jgi:N-acetylmuramoyl-L-alanine amidase
MLTSTLCLAMAIYHEARGESLIGRQAIAEVVLNRSEQTSTPICKVVFAPHQFSWSNRHKLPPKDSNTWQECLSIAKHSLIVKSNHTKGATYFNTRSIGVRFNKERKATIGGHVFF